MLILFSGSNNNILAYENIQPPTRVKNKNNGMLGSFFIYQKRKGKSLDTRKEMLVGEERVPF